MHLCLQQVAFAEEVSSYLGTELDLVWVKKLKEGVTFNLGYSQMFAAEGAAAVKSALTLTQLLLTKAGLGS